MKLVCKCWTTTPVSKIERQTSRSCVVLEPWSEYKTVVSFCRYVLRLVFCFQVLAKTHQSLQFCSLQCVVKLTCLAHQVSSCFAFLSEKNGTSIQRSAQIPRTKVGPRSFGSTKLQRPSKQTLFSSEMSFSGWKPVPLCRKVARNGRWCFWDFLVQILRDLRRLKGQPTLSKRNMGDWHKSPAGNIDKKLVDTCFLMKINCQRSCRFF